MNNGSCALPLVSDVMVFVVDAELTEIVLPAVAEDTQRRADRIRELQASRAERGRELRDDRRDAAGKIDADDLIVRIGGHGIRKRQRGRIVDANDRDVVRARSTHRYR